MCVLYEEISLNIANKVYSKVQRLSMKNQLIISSNGDNMYC